MRLRNIWFGRRPLRDELLLFLVFSLVDLAARKAFIEDVERNWVRTGFVARMAPAAAGMALMGHGVPFLVPHAFTFP
jgi:hypothetical protein